ncbi:xylulokinase [Oceanirhabdus seepicola]|uniref:Xylulose kinase n=1 Tax=Oceanirhabdus seepicola TaxID=2828781 RepID=A0A9J6P6K9_9CLOT|nr:xylulokinase [Oceanirhabdus seepicola]MCM1991737.1 xylulokinase [Oceanirhabdus seepicola]
MLYLGLDLGTSAVKLLLMDEKGEVLKTVSKSYSVHYLNQIWAEQNPNDWWNAVSEGIKTIFSDIDSSSLKGISLSGQMHGLVMLDENDEVIRPAILWCDQRTEEECNYLNNEIGKDKLSKWTGNIVLTGFTAPKVLWVKNNEPENFDKIRKIMLPKDYIVYKLSGKFSTDVSDASGTVFFDVENREWSQEMIDVLGIKKEWLPRVYESYEAVGEITHEVAEVFGIPNNVVVVAGAGDQAAGAIGIGAVREGIALVALGTSGVVFSSTENYHVDEKNSLHSFAHANGKWHQMGVMLSAGASLKWWIESVNETQFYQSYLEEAEKIPVGSEKLYYLPYLMGERTPHNDIYAKGCFIGLNITHKKAHMTRAVLEGVAYGLKDSLELLREIGVKVNRVRVSGGGTKSRLWRQIIADVFNAKVETIQSNEGSAYGAAILASVGTGLFDTVDEACNTLIKVKEEVTPNTEDVKKYEQTYPKFKRLYTSLKENFLDISTD